MAEALASISAINTTTPSQGHLIDEERIGAEEE